MQEIFKYYMDINKIKHIERTGWKKYVEKGPRDTIASHSLGAALIGWYLAVNEDADHDKVMKICIIHDLIMAHLKDYTPFDEEYEIKKQMKKRKLDFLYSNLPAVIRSEFKQLFEEYQDEESKEAIIAKESYKLDTLLQAYMYSLEHGSDILDSFLEIYEPLINTKTGKNIIKEIKAKIKN